jgi:O-succinylbenzoic acid--CoA ligase
VSSVESWLLRAARRRPDHEALLGTTYAALADEVRGVARGLRSAGARPGERVGLVLPPGREFVVALHALLLAGAEVVPLDPRLPAPERDRRLAGAALTVDAGLDLDALPDDGGAVPCARHDLEATAIVVHTSGTSGPAKPIPLSFRNWLWSALGSAAALGCPPDERWLCALPLNHVGGLSVLLRSAIAGTTAVVHEGWDTERVLAELRGELGRPAPTVVSLVPTTLRRLLDAGLTGPGSGGAGRAPALRWVLLGGAAIPGGMLEEAAEAGLPVAPTYGMSEATSQIVTNGVPLFCTRVEIAGPDGVPTLEPGITGEVLVSGLTVSREVVGPDGRLRTGDLGVLDERGHLAIVGRSSDTIITGGENVLPLEVERVLEGQPGVVEAAVFGRPDREWGERVCALLVAAPGARIDVEAVRGAAAAALLPHQRPRELEVVETLPRTPSGKLLRRELR